MGLTAENFSNAAEYIKIFLYNLQRVIFWTRYILLYLIGGIIALDQICIVLYYHNIFMLISLAISLLLTLMLLPRITSSNYATLYNRYLAGKNQIKPIDHIKDKMNFWVQYCYDVTVGFTLTTHMLMFYCPQIAVIILRTYSPVILIIIAFVFYAVAALNHPQYKHKTAVNRALSNSNGEESASIPINKNYLTISIILSLVVFFSLNKYFFGRALVIYLYSPPTILAAAILILGVILAKFGCTSRSWSVIQATAMGLGTSYTIMLLGKIVYLAFYDSMLVTGSTANIIILALPSMPYIPILMFLACVLGVGYGFSYYKDLVAENKALTVLTGKEILTRSTCFGFISQLDLSESNMEALKQIFDENSSDAKGEAKAPGNT